MEVRRSGGSLLGLEVGVGVCLGSLGLVWQHVSCSQLI